MPSDACEPNLPAAGWQFCCCPSLLLNDKHSSKYAKNMLPFCMQAKFCMRRKLDWPSENTPIVMVHMVMLHYLELVAFKRKKNQHLF